MILNHRRLPVSRHDGGPSKCPDCGADLIARRGDVVVWHWAHEKSDPAHDGCAWEESRWHLQWKDAYLSVSGWGVEHRVTLGGAQYVLDAFNEQTGRVREFVHSLSPRYAAKHRALSAHFGASRVGWIWDGNEFASLRAKHCAGDGRRDFLKPRAYEAYTSIGGLVHVPVGEDRGMWRHWKGNVFYRSPEHDAFVAAFTRAAA